MTRDAALLRNNARATPPDRETAVPEAGVELVDRPLEQRLRLAGGPEHRVAGHAVVDPAGRVPLEQRVGDRRQHEVGAAERLVQQHAHGVVRQIRYGDAADEMDGEPHGRHLIQPGAHDLHGGDPDGVGGDAAVEHELPRLRIVERRCQQVVQVQHLDPALLHLQHEVVVVLLRLVHPDDVVEQKVVAVAGSEALVRQRRPANQDGPQLADFRMHADFRHDASPCFDGPGIPRAGLVVSCRRPGRPMSRHRGLIVPVHMSHAARTARTAMSAAMTISTPVKARSPHSRRART